jgi:thiol:disulfide interchange protein DsbD
MAQTWLFLAIAYTISLYSPAAWGISAGTDTFSRALSQGPAAATLAAWFGGVLVSLTPCVYPMIAVTVSVFGARQTQSRWEGVGLSAAFVAGIVAMFVPLGVVAGLTGSLFGAVLQNRWVVVGISALFCAMGASMLGGFEFALPASFTNRLATVGGIGARGAFLLGLVSALIAAPCTGPVLTGILTFIARTRSIVWGAAAMAAFALGLGLPFFVVGGFAVQLPKSGRWMVHIKSLFGVVLLVVAVYFLGTAFPSVPRSVPGGRLGVALAAAAILVGLLLGVVELDTAKTTMRGRLGKSASVVLLTAGSFGAIALATRPKASLAWQYLPVSVARAQAIGQSRPLLVDFDAAWCAACKELDRVTFPHPLVIEAAARFVAVKVDATNDDDPQVSATLRELNVVGLPTVLLFDSQGHEAHRFTDFVTPEVMAAALRAVP